MPGGTQTHTSHCPDVFLDFTVLKDIFFTGQNGAKPYQAPQGISKITTVSRRIVVIGEFSQDQNNFNAQ